MTAATAAVVRDGAVINMIVVDIDAERHTTFTLDGTPYYEAELIVLPDGSPAGIGWTYDGADFIAPPPPPEPDPEPDPEEPTDPDA